MSKLGFLTMSRLERITTAPDVCGGQPCIRGVRVRVSGILDMLASGASREDILESYPYLEPEDIDAALEYAARLARHQVVHVA